MKKHKSNNSLSQQSSSLSFRGDQARLVASKTDEIRHPIHQWNDVEWIQAGGGGKVEGVHVSLNCCILVIKPQAKGKDYDYHFRQIVQMKSPRDDEVRG